MDRRQHQVPRQPGIAIAIDAIWVVLYAAYLAGARAGRPQPAAERSMV
jgi:hypothetical protein